MRKRKTSCLQETFPAGGKTITQDIYLRDWDDIPEFLKWNEYITGGYRCYFTWKGCMFSLFTLHNETMNVWTHLAGFFLFFYFTYEVTTSTLKGAEFVHYILFLIFLVSAIYAFLCSSLYHLFMCVDEPTLYAFLRFDYSGIAALIVGSYVPPLFYAYYEHLAPLVIYLGGIAVIGAILIISSIFPFFHSNSFTPIRTLLFVLVAAFGFIPTIHMNFFLSPSEPVLHDHSLIHARIYGMYLVYSLGVLFYIFKLPESLLPGKFNIWVIGGFTSHQFHSHQFWHIFVLAGTLIHYGTVNLIYENWKCNQFFDVHPEYCGPLNALGNTTAPIKF